MPDLQAGPKAVDRCGRLCYTHADFGAHVHERLQVALPCFPFRKMTGRACETGRVDVSESASISSGIAARYATAIFELAREGESLDALESDAAALSAVLDDSADLAGFIASPIHSRDEQAKAVAVIAAGMNLSAPVSNALGLMAARRRLFVLPQLLRALGDMIAREKGEITADVAAARALTGAQSDKLAGTLKAATGKTVRINAAVDESLIGGLVVKVGSKMIDTSIRSRLNALRNSMKEVG